MKNNSIKLVLLALIGTLILFGVSCSDKPLIDPDVTQKSLLDCSLDSIKDSSQLVLELKDVYHAFKIHNFLEEQKDFVAIDSTLLLISYLNSKAEECDSLYKLYLFHDDSLEMLVNDYILATKTQFEVKVNTLRFPPYNASDTNKNKSIPYQNGERVNFLNYLHSKYKNERFLTLSEKEYWKNIDKSEYIESEEFEEYERLKIENPKKAVDKIIEIINEGENFQEKSIYGIDLADFYIVGSMDTDTILKEERAVSHYQAIMNAEKYSLYLFEAWIKWRAVTQDFHYGSSKSSSIPNDLYNKWRNRSAFVVLKHISAHPDDQMAVNQFLLFATHQNIKRFGAYKYGNQNVLDYYILFKTDKKNM